MVVVLDKFYTTQDTVENCIELFKKHIKYKSNDLIIEPSAGNGAFIEQIKSLGTKTIFYDISPEHNEIIKQDFLKEGIPEEQPFPEGGTGRVHVIGNPPFGRQSSLAIKFIKKSSKFADSISFILPKSFKKQSLQKKIPLNFHLLIEKETNKFIIEKDGIFKQHNVPCVFQIWEKKDYDRISSSYVKPIGFKFVKIMDNPDISLRRVGSNSGLVSKIKACSIQSNYFIKFDNFDDELLNKLKQLKIKEAYFTTGPKSISKSELIPVINSILEKQKND
jgi:predicted RNA methylase